MIADMIIILHVFKETALPCISAFSLVLHKSVVQKQASVFAISPTATVVHPQSVILSGRGRHPLYPNTSNPKAPKIVFCFTKNCSIKSYIRLQNYRVILTCIGVATSSLAFSTIYNSIFITTIALAWLGLIGLAYIQKFEILL